MLGDEAADNAIWRRQAAAAGGPRSDNVSTCCAGYGCARTCSRWKLISSWSGYR